jgi:hypothetical protein
MRLAGYAYSSHLSLEGLALASDGRTRAQRDKDPAMPDSPKQRDDKYQAVEGGTETMSGETLLVEAYAGLWVILFAFIFVSWRRQTKIDARVAELERAVARGQAK